MSTTYTPGPWEPSVETGFVYSVHHCLIAEVYSGDGHGQQSANARLIAAAPELLEACIEALENDESCEGFNAANMDQALREKLRAAIAKAAGK